MSETTEALIGRMLGEHRQGRDIDAPEELSMFCDCGEMVYTCAIDKGSLHRTHVAAAIAEALAGQQAVAWEVGYLRGAHDTEGDLERADNPFEEER